MLWVLSKNSIEVISLKQWINWRLDDAKNYSVARVDGVLT